MTKLFSISFLLFLLSCRNHNLGKTLLPPDKKDINEIIEAVISSNSLSFTKKSATDSNAIPLLINLRKLKIILTDTTSELPPPMDLTKVSIFDLFNIIVDRERFFSITDSSYFFFQNDTVKDFTIDKTIVDKLTVNTTFTRQYLINNSNNSSPYYDLTIPIFSLNNKKAYVEWTNNCSFCGGATSFYLQKKDSKWNVVGWQNRWKN